MSVPNLDRFSRPLSHEITKPAPEPYVFESEPEFHCACGCGEQIWLEDEESYVESDLWEDEWIVNDPQHIQRYYRNCRKNDRLVGSQSLR